MAALHQIYSTWLAGVKANNELSHTPGNADEEEEENYDSGPFLVIGQVHCQW